MRRAREIRIGAGPPGRRVGYDLSWIWKAAIICLGVALAIALATSIPW